MTEQLSSSPTPAESGPTPEGPRLINRDLSWLAFNDRVLAQAADDRLPLLERVKFCAIHGSNLDEFVMKRVGLAKRRFAHSPDMATRDGTPVAELLLEMRRRILDQQRRLAGVWQDMIIPALAENGIRIVRYAELAAGERDELDRWFDARVFPILTPLAVDPSHRFPFISNLSENFGVLLRRAKDPAAPAVFARLKIPSVVPRFIAVPQPAGGHATPHSFHLCPLDEVIAGNLDRLFPGMSIEAIAPFRVTRSAAVDAADEEGDDLLEQIEDELRRRRFATAIRLEAPEDAPDRVLQYVVTQLGLSEDDVYRRPGPLEWEDLFQIASLPRPDLQQEPWTPAVHPRLRGLPELPPHNTPVLPTEAADGEPRDTIFDRIRAGDILLHHPYDSFAHSTERFVAEAARDPAVLAIKQTIYRTSPGSPFVRSLAEAAEDGKNVAALVELRARFDEERNVAFARQLELAGVHVAYGVQGLKTHCKLSLVVRQEEDGLRTYAHIGTGNYHPKTAQLYTDLGLLTADPKITAGVVAVFNMLTGHADEARTAPLLVAPRRMRARFLELIDREADHARAGRPARIVVKMNQLEDGPVIERLVEASRAGVPITCYVRGFCCLRPGVRGRTESIRVVSIVGRFLEHARIFSFANGRDDPLDAEYYLGSADWMSRNLSDRVEVATPVRDREAKAKLWRIFEVMAADNRNAWELGPDGRYTRLDPAPGDPLRGTFMTLMADARAQQTPA